MVVPSSLVNMGRLKDGNVGMEKSDTCVKLYGGKWRLLLVLNLTRQKLEENEEITVKKNIKGTLMQLWKSLYKFVFI